MNKGEMAIKGKTFRKGRFYDESGVIKSIGL